MQKNKIPNHYNHFQSLKKHLGNDLSKIFSNKIVYPVQLEIQLPGNGKQACNLSCKFCCGKKLSKKLSRFEPKLLKLLQALKGRIKQHIYAGAFTEPLLNRHFIELVETTKKTGSFYGIKTNGTLLTKLEKEKQLASRLVKASNSSNDFISISLDAGNKESYEKIKGKDCFEQVIEGINLLSRIRGKGKKPSISITFLLTKENSSLKEIRQAINLAQKAKANFLRFSLPDFHNREKTTASIQAIKKEISKFKKSKTRIFYAESEFQKPEKIKFKQCITGYYKITAGSDGYFYKCSISSSPTFKKQRIGKITGKLSSLKKAIKKAQNSCFDPQECNLQKAQCDRVSAQINKKWHEIKTQTNTKSKD